MLENHYVYKKEVDWSLLHEGLSIPLNIQVVFQNSVMNFIPRGDKKDINLVLDGNTYKAKLVNQKFNETKYNTHKDILQIRYNPQSEIAVKLRSMFIKSYNFIKERRVFLKSENKKTYLKIPEDNKEYFAIYTTEYPDTYLVECITNDDVLIATRYFAKEIEEDYERELNFDLVDASASIESKLQVMKYRKLNRAIGENLKLHYDYKCQICGENFGCKYDTQIVETHHIDPYVISLNNDASNQIVICPNHHRVIHKTKPVLDRRKLLFIYLNGVEEKVLINDHL